MNAEQLLADLRGRGFSLVLSDDGARVVVTPASALTAADRQAILECRQDILSALAEPLTAIDHAIAAWLLDHPWTDLPSGSGLVILRLEGCPPVAMRVEDLAGVAMHNEAAHERALSEAHASPSRRKVRSEDNEPELFALED
jgi:hypothetical protein